MQIGTYSGGCKGAYARMRVDAGRGTSDCCTVAMCTCRLTCHQPQPHDPPHQKVVSPCKGGVHIQVPAARGTSVSAGWWFYTERAFGMDAI